MHLLFLAVCVVTVAVFVYGLSRRNEVVIWQEPNIILWRPKKR